MINSYTARLQVSDYNFADYLEKITTNSFLVLPLDFVQNVTHLVTTDWKCLRSEDKLKDLLHSFFEIWYPP